jgi:hypothetical protein
LTTAKKGLAGLRQLGHEVLVEQAVVHGQVVEQRRAQHLAVQRAVRRGAEQELLEAAPVQALRAVQRGVVALGLGRIPQQRVAVEARVRLLGRQAAEQAGIGDVAAGGAGQRA